MPLDRTPRRARAGGAGRDTQQPAATAPEPSPRRALPAQPVTHSVQRSRNSARSTDSTTVSPAFLILKQYVNLQGILSVKKKNPVPFYYIGLWAIKT